jgi:hypothetical protein
MFLEFGIPTPKISVSDTHGSGTTTGQADGKPWQVPNVVVDVRRMFGENAVLVDSRGHMVPTNDMGVSFHPLHASEGYTVLRYGHIYT